MQEIIIVIIVAFFLDFVIGDPQNPFHPIRIIGIYISLAIKFYRILGITNKAFSFIFGTFVSVFIIFATYFVTNTIIHFCIDINYFLGLFIQVVLCYFIIAAKALKDESMKVYNSIKSKNLNDARIKLSYIVGRDTSHLEFSQIIKATVETIAENLSDGVIAPLIFVFIGGVPLGMAYKAVNTLDSMIGYKNETFEYFGKFAAKLDDIANFVPSRISAILLIVSTMFTKGNLRQAIKIFKRDRYNHKSPNSAQTESVCAGALCLQLGGDNYYHGVIVHKPTIGDNINEPELKHIVIANKMMYVSCVIIIILMTIISIIK